MSKIQKKIRDWKTKDRGPIFEFRRLISFLHPKPHFLIIGAQKTGTTSLNSLFAQHPLCSPSKYGTEIHFFDTWLGVEKRQNYEKGFAWYRIHFDAEQGRQYHFETTPAYIFHPNTAERIKRNLPNVKMIAILRDPTERAISQYWMNVRKGREPLSLYEALVKEDQRLSNETELGWETYYHGYKARGRYAEQLLRFYKLFPREQIHLIRSENLRSYPLTELDRATDFLGIDKFPQKLNLEELNKGNYMEEPNREAFEYLKAYFKPYNDELSEMVGDNFQLWNEI